MRYFRAGQEPAGIHEVLVACLCAGQVRTNDRGVGELVFSIQVFSRNERRINEAALNRPKTPTPAVRSVLVER